MYEFALGDKAGQIQIDARGTVQDEQVAAARRAIESLSFDPVFPTPPETWMPGAAPTPLPVPIPKPITGPIFTPAPR